MFNKSTSQGRYNLIPWFKASALRVYPVLLYVPFVYPLITPAARNWHASEGRVSLGFCNLWLVSEISCDCQARFIISKSFHFHATLPACSGEANELILFPSMGVSSYLGNLGIGISRYVSCMARSQKISKKILAWVPVVRASCARGLSYFCSRGSQKYKNIKKS